MFAHTHTYKHSSTWFHFIRFQVHNIIIVITKTSHKPKSTRNHTQPTIDLELVAGACKRGNNPRFLMNNTNLKGHLGKGTKGEENTYLFDIQTFEFLPKNFNQEQV